MAHLDDVLAAEQAAFARAVKAVITGDTAALRAALSAEPALVRARSRAAHRATLLHYTAANGIEDGCSARSRTPTRSPACCSTPARRRMRRATPMTADIRRL